MPFTKTTTKGAGKRGANLKAGSKDHNDGRCGSNAGNLSKADEQMLEESTAMLAPALQSDAAEGSSSTGASGAAEREQPHGQKRKRADSEEEHDGADNAALRNEADAHFNQGFALYEKGDTDGAIESHKRALSVDPEYANAHYGLAAALSEKGDLDGAIVSYKRAISLDPKYADAHFMLGVAQHNKGDLDCAIVSWKQALSLDPEHVQARTNMDMALRMKPGGGC